jgi:hypothetical protein
VLGHKSRCFTLWINFNLSSKLKKIDLLKKRIRRIERERRQQYQENSPEATQQPSQESNKRQETISLNFYVLPNLKRKVLQKINQ